MSNAPGKPVFSRPKVEYFSNRPCILLLQINLGVRIVRQQLPDAPNIVSHYVFSASTLIPLLYDDLQILVKSLTLLVINCNDVFQETRKMIMQKMHFDVLVHVGFQDFLYNFGVILYWRISKKVPDKFFE